MTLVLADVRVLSDDEKKLLLEFAAHGKLVVTGPDAIGIGESANVVRFADDPGKAYNAALE